MLLAPEHRLVLKPRHPDNVDVSIKAVAADVVVALHEDRGFFAALKRLHHFLALVGSGVCTAAAGMLDLDYLSKLPTTQLHVCFHVPDIIQIVTPLRLREHVEVCPKVKPRRKPRLVIIPGYEMRKNPVSLRVVIDYILRLTVDCGFVD